MKFQDVLIDGSIEKLGLDLPSRQQHEQDFGNMAYVFFRDRAPQLIPYLLGFETVEMEDDGSKAIGIFGAKVGDQLFYVPVFFINNQIKGMDTLYSVDKDVMVPLTEPWINNLINKQNITIGDQTNTKIDEFIAPDFNFLREIPTRTGRIPQGGANYKMAESLADITYGWELLTKSTNGRFSSDTSLRADMARALKTRMAEDEDHEKLAEEAGPTLLQRYLSEVAGPDAASKLLKKCASDKKFGNNLLSFYSLEDIKNIDYKLKIEKTAASKVEVMTSTYDYGKPQTVSSEDKRKIVRDGFAINDTRKPEEKAKVYGSDRFICANPDLSGMYNVYIQTGANKEMAVLKPSYGATNHSTEPITLVIDPVTGAYFTADSGAVLTAGQVVDPDEINLPSSKRIIGIDEIKPDDKIVFINDSYDSSYPLKVNYVERDKDNLSLRCDLIDESSKYKDDNYTPRYDNDHGISPYSWDNIIVTFKKGPGQIRQVNKTLIVPEDGWKVFKLSDHKESDRAKSIRPATHGEVQMRLASEGIRNIKVKSDDKGITYSIWMDEQPSQYEVTYKTAMIDLVKNYEFPVHDAEVLLKEASVKWKAERLFHKGAQSVAMPVDPGPPPMGYDEQIGVPVQLPQQTTVSGSTMSPPQEYVGAGYGGNIGGEASMQQQPLPDQEAMQLAQQAAATGQHGVFDAATIGALAKNYNPANVVDTFIPEMMKTLDRLGRILFLFYWKNEDFADRYGDQDMTSLEDELVSVYRNLGDLIIKFKQKTIDADGEGVVLS